MELEGAKERLRLFKANLVEDGSFDSAIHGCHAVFHTASPVALDNAVINDPHVHFYPYLIILLQIMHI